MRIGRLTQRSIQNYSEEYNTPLQECMEIYSEGWEDFPNQLGNTDIDSPSLYGLHCLRNYLQSR